MGSDMDGKWQVGFWVMCTICTVWLMALTQSVVANDRLNASYHEKVVELINGNYLKIIERLTVIESKLNRNYDTANRNFVTTDNKMDALR
jgi:hypothetical protein